MSTPVDFTTYTFPVLAVRCPRCGAAAGRHCKRPSEHNVMGKGFHDSRGTEADRLFVAQHGNRATISRAGDTWLIDPVGLPADDPRALRYAATQECPPAAPTPIT
jgi:hypothetical protein